MWKINAYYGIQRKEVEEMWENDKENMAHATSQAHNSTGTISTKDWSKIVRAETQHRNAISIV